MYLVSACLVGVKCRYDGTNVPDETLQELFESGQAFPVCPELLGGLPCPRECCEIIQTDNKNRRVISKSNKDFTSEFEQGATQTLELCKTLGITAAILKSKSPSCGYGQIYDGSFSGNLIEGNGLAAELLAKNNITVFDELNWQSE